MGKPLRVLMVEDVEQDALLAVRELTRGGFDVTFERVDTPEAMSVALAAQLWDVIISDYSMPRFSALLALALMKERNLDLPFIIVSGTVGEDVAVEALRAGAHDFMVKGKFARLVPAVERELRDWKARQVNRHSAQALRESEIRFKRLFESGIMGIVISDASGLIAEANDAYLGMVGYTREDLVAGKIRWTDMTPPEWRPSHVAAVEQLRATGVARPWEKEYLRKDGSRVPVLVAVASLGDAHNVSITVDLSERKHLEAQLRQAQKMEAIGSLAGGIAHDFNNLLSVILSYSDMVADDLRPGDPMRADLGEIKAAGLRATDLTRQLLAFSRRQALQPRVIELNDTAAAMTKMLRRLVGEDVELVVVPSSTVGKVHADPGQIEQVIMNLAVNARDAMPTGGRLTIEIVSIELDAAYAAEHVGATSGPHVMLAVSDTGTGMDDATLRRMFEPFFTTKEKGKGTGLGLSTVFGIVHQSGGSISVCSEPGEGTTFKIYLPQIDPNAPLDAASATTSEIAAPRGSETILLAEDDPSVRTLARTILARHGYQVLEAESGGDALLICEQHKATIHMLLTDVVMPRMSGRQLADRLRSLRPAMIVLYMSGYTDNVNVHHGVLDSNVAFIQKPITPGRLARKVREVLDGPT